MTHADDPFRQQHAVSSSLRERILEHSLIADIWRLLWIRGVVDVEILKSEIDAYGYDLVISRGSIVRHVQLKAGRNDGPKSAAISVRLALKPSACVVWLDVGDDLLVNEYWYYGAGPGEPLPGLEGLTKAKRIGRNSAGERPDRQNHVKVGRSAYDRLRGLEELVIRLIGDLDPTDPDDADTSLKVGEEGSERDSGILLVDHPTAKALADAKCVSTTSTGRPS